MEESMFDVKQAREEEKELLREILRECKNGTLSSVTELVESYL